MAIILASQSPRRKQLLEMLGLEFTVIPAKGEETIPYGAGPEETVRALSRQKAEAVASGRHYEIARTVEAVEYHERASAQTMTQNRQTLWHR